MASQVEKRNLLIDTASSSMMDAAEYKISHVDLIYLHIIIEHRNRAVIQDNLCRRKNTSLMSAASN